MTPNTRRQLIEIRDGLNNLIRNTAVDSMEDHSSAMLDEEHRELLQSNLAAYGDGKTPLTESTDHHPSVVIYGVDCNPMPGFEDRVVSTPQRVKIRMDKATPGQSDMLVVVQQFIEEHPTFRIQNIEFHQLAQKASEETTE